MSTASLLDTRFDDSEEEDDNFNPAPADLSDEENGAEGDHASEIPSRNDAKRRATDDDDDAEDDGAIKTNGKGRPSNVEDNGDDDEGEGAGDDEEDEDEDEEDEEDEEEEVTVSY